MNYVVAPIVEGHGDFLAAPKLIIKVATLVRVAAPVRFPKSKLLAPGGLERAAAIARSNIPGRGLILLLIDADEHCAATLGPGLSARLATAATGRDFFVALAIREFENWIVGGIEELGEMDPDGSGAPKDRLRGTLAPNYKETADQARLTSRIDIERLRRSSASFARLWRRLSAIA